MWHAAVVHRRIIN